MCPGQVKSHCAATAVKDRGADNQPEVRTRVTRDTLEVWDFIVYYWQANLRCHLDVEGDQFGQ